MGSGIISRHRKAIGIYLLWLLINLSILFIFSEYPLNNHNRDKFWPFTTYHVADIDRYDITEFAFYMILPAIIYFAICLLKPKKNREAD